MKMQFVMPAFFLYPEGKGDGDPASNLTRQDLDSALPCLIPVVFHGCLPTFSF